LTTKDDKGVVDVARSSKGRRTRQGFIIYEEFSITMRVNAGGDFIKFVVGHERTSPSDSNEALTKTEKAAWAWNEKTADRRVRMLKRMMRAIQAQEG
jgi:hypothetical protein